jgi:hypothetical protein
MATESGPSMTEQDEHRLDRFGSQASKAKAYVHRQAKDTGQEMTAGTLVGIGHSKTVHGKHKIQLICML